MQMLSPSNMNMLSKIRDALVEESDRIDERQHAVAEGNGALMYGEAYSDSSATDVAGPPKFARNHIGDDPRFQRQQTKVCRFCYSEEPSGEWLSPCKCSGSIKWVHESCFDRWLSSAPLLQQAQCATCKYMYKKMWRMKPYRDWCLPDLKSTRIEIIQITYDTICTYRLFTTFKDFFSGRRSILAVLAGVCFWRLFVITDRRIIYWTNLFRCFASSVFRITVVNAM